MDDLGYATVLEYVAEPLHKRGVFVSVQDIKEQAMLLCRDLDDRCTPQAPKVDSLQVESNNVGARKDGTESDVGIGLVRGHDHRLLFSPRGSLSCGLWRTNAAGEWSSEQTEPLK